jgi:hypothetical protein
VRRGLSNVVIQAYLTAAVINLKRLAASVGLFFAQFWLYFYLLLAQKRFDVVISKVFSRLRRKRMLRKVG